MTDPNKDLSVTGDQDKRQKELSKNRSLYRWYRNYLPGIPTLFNKKLGDHIEGSENLAFDITPAPEGYHDAMLSPLHLGIIGKLAETLEGDELDKAIANHPDLQPDDDDDEGDDGVVAGGEEAFGLFSDYNGQTGVPKSAVPAFASYLVPRGLFNAANAREAKRLEKDPPSLEGPADYQKIYNAYFNFAASKPNAIAEKVMAFEGFADLYSRNDFFAWQRLAGTNPRVLKQLNAERHQTFRAKMTLTDAHVQAVAGADSTVEGEVAAGRLFYCDYELLSIMELQQGRYLAPAIGVFWSNPTGILEPVAIQLQQTPGRVYTPDEAEWESARVYFSSADFNYHEMGTHLSEAHFAQEAFAIATARNLSKNHPIGALFNQIYYALFFNNALGRQLLVNPGGFTDKMMAGDLEKGSIKLVVEFYKQVWTWDDWNLPNYLARQGTDDAASLPVYPYRDDGVPLWNVIREFAGRYVEAYYDRDAVVANDRELQGFMNELNDPEMGGLSDKGFPARLMTREDLAELVARLVWQASPGHGGINYSQYQYFAPIANAPGATYADPAAGDTLANISRILPPTEQALTQGNILNTLTQKVFGTLGDYDRKFHRHLNHEAKRAVEQFQGALQQCSREVERRNSEAPRSNYKYVFLSPANLPNSTNI